jgi:acyl-CoA synthetase (AMP-forming)/AMP-acid ligase II
MPEAPAPLIAGDPIDPPAPALTIPEFIRQRARLHPDSPAIVDGVTGRELRYGELDRLIGRAAAGLAARGLREGDTVLLFSPNSPEWVIVALGAMALGGRATGANPSYTAAELAHQIRDSGARLAFTLPGLLDTVRQATAGTDCTQIVVDGGAEGCLSLAGLLSADGPEPTVRQDPEAIALLPYSSGTTGLPKGVMLTHRAVVVNVCQTLQSFCWPDDVVSLGFLPMFHAMGFSLTTLCTLAHGAKLVTLPRFEPQSFLGAIATHRVTDLIAVPPVMQFIAAHPMVDQFDLSSLRIVGTGGAPMSAALEARVTKRIGCPCSQGYGMTEMTAAATLGLAPQTRRAGSVGRVAPGVQLRIVDPQTGRDLGRGEQGELWVRTPSRLTGYLNNPQATSELLTADGWLRTGDLGFVDEDGFVFITDRLKELIKVKGLQVAPAELEALLLTHPSVADAAVIGRPDERAGELPVAYVAFRGPPDPDGVKAWLAGRVAPHKQLAAVVAIEAIPKNPSGKLLRRVLRAQDAALSGGSA